jgi:carbonic anhydrase
VVSRRRLLAGSGAALLALPLGSTLLAACDDDTGSDAGGGTSDPTGTDPDPDGAGPVTNPDEALARLVAGNVRYEAGLSAYPNQETWRRDELVGGQDPFAVIVTCSDSRVPPNLVFDQGLGDLFVARLPGNAVITQVIGAAEYAVEEFGCKLVMVLGHDKCGAVEATVEVVETNTEPPGDIGSLVDPIRPAVEAVEHDPGDLVENAVRENVLLGVQRLDGVPLLAEHVEAGELVVVGAVYSLETGRVEIIT